jgi:hypothetical protein
MAKKRQIRVRKNAVLIDVANVCELDLDKMMRAARRQGRIEILRGYGNFANRCFLSHPAERLFLHGVRLIHCPAWRNASGEWKDCADEMMMHDIHQILVARTDIDRFVICTGDGHFVPVALAIRASGREVVVISPPDGTSRMLGEVATRCLTVPHYGSELPKGDGDSPSDNADGTRRDGHPKTTQRQTGGGNGSGKGRIRPTGLPPLRKPGAAPT